MTARRVLLTTIAWLLGGAIVLGVVVLTTVALEFLRGISWVSTAADFTATAILGLALLASALLMWSLIYRRLFSTKKENRDD